ncbi:hypothetical protein PQX77_009403 [Marasmius sp. AFHP31]|nr:hypothetical protein PQX77_009403 [Marasmius sp. AFHP31]
MEVHEVADFGKAFYTFKGSLGEGPIYRAEDDTLHYVLPLSDPAEIHILSLAERDLGTEMTALKRYLSDSITMLAFVKDRPNTYIGGSKSGIAMVDENSGDIQVLKDLIPESQHKQVRINDGAVDSKGRLWIGEFDIPATFQQVHKTDPSYKPQGRLWRYDPDGTITKHGEGLYGSNGLAWSLDDRYMFHIDSGEGVVRRYEFDVEKGTLSNRIDWVDFRDGAGAKNGVPEYLQGGVPDGMVIDSEGNLWIAILGKGRVVCFSSSEQGVIMREIRAPEETPNLTCPGWGGKDLGVLYCTSANFEGDESTRTSNVFRLNVGSIWGVKGVEKYKFGA